MKDPRRRYKDEAAPGYYYCRICSKRIMKKELVVCDGLYYHRVCYGRVEAAINKTKNRLAAANNVTYYEMLRKHMGLRDLEEV